jgi:hypothetical protein
MKWLKRLLLVFLILFAAAQFIRPRRENAPVDATKTIFAVANVPPDVTSILDRSCNDCHTDTVRWPWYSAITPLNFLVAEDVEHGREELNLSTWGRYDARRQARKLEELCEEVEEGEMPLPKYLYLHPRAKLSDADKQRLCAWSSALRAQIVAAHPDALRRRSRR